MHRRRTSRIAATVVAVSALVLGVTACGSSGGSDNSAGDGGGDSSSQQSTAGSGGTDSSADGDGGGSGGTLTVWMKKQLYAKQNDVFKKQAEAFGKEHGMKVDVEIIANEDFAPKWAAALQSGNVPDVTYLGYQQAGQFYAQGVLEDLSSVVKDIESTNGKISPSIMKSVTFDGAPYAVPMWAEAQVLYYRTDLFKKAGIAEPPSTWDEFRADAKKLTGSGVYGAGIGFGQKDSDAEWWARAVAWSYGGTLGASPDDYSDDAKAANAKAVSFVKSIFDDGSVPTGALNWDDAGNNTSYISGQSAMVFNTGSILGTLKEKRPDLLKNTAVAPFPAGPKGSVTPGIVNGMGIFKKAKHPEAAEKFIEYMLNMTQYKEWTELGAPLAIPVYPKLSSSGVWVDEPNKAFADSVDQFVYLGAPGAYTPAAGTVYNDRLVNKAFQDVLINGTPIDQALETLRTGVKKVYAGQ